MTSAPMANVNLLRLIAADDVEVAASAQIAARVRGATMEEVPVENHHLMCPGVVLIGDPSIKASREHS